MNSDSINTLNIQHDPKSVPELAEAWEISVSNALYHSASYEDFQNLASEAGENKRRIVSLIMADGRRIFLPFLRERHIHKFKVGERRLGALTADVLQLANPWMVEGLPPETIATALQHILRAENADFLVLGEIPECSSLRAALSRLPWPAKTFAIGRRESLRWLVNFPDSFDQYLAGLSSGTRQSVKRKCRKLERDFDVTLETIFAPEHVDRFLEEGEKISALTYQWHVGQRLLNDADTRKRYMALAEQGRLRCYLMSLDGTPRAFLRGTIEHGIYHYETPGFDPEFRKTSIGTIILIETFKDLILNTACRTFDFGTGGDETGYKSTFGTRHIICNSYHVLALNRPRSLAILALEGTLRNLKNFSDRIVPEGNFRDRIKRKLRKYGGRPD